MTNQSHADRALDELPANGPHLLMADHHHSIESAYQAMEAAVLADDGQDVLVEFECFEQAVLDHIAAEEEVILPAYELFHPEDAALIRADHARFRDVLGAAGVETQLHALRAQRMKQLIEWLRAHAKHEDRHMYPWAQVHLPLDARTKLVARLSRSIGTLVALADRALRDR